ncbi:hypothetical protein L6452_08802 [Arctium lappa]|uniref:Uncharacterized protein n=1 Tax=Arctium lappa TaxID=4217 RepID=A0ACB9DIQ9_ARCLA|nr:hypothetical protein L6452_08802 [Arctium lappa]
MDTLRTRTSPRTLYETIIRLTTAQKKAIADMGLGSLVHMSLDGVPSKKGFYVVDILNTRTMTLDLKSGSIPITVESSHNLLDLPKASINILDLEDLLEANRTTNEWKKQFNKSKMHPMDVIKVILQNNYIGISNDGSGTMTSVSMLVLDITDATVSTKVEIPEIKPALAAWNVGLLRKRESIEEEMGGFGLMPIKREYMIKLPKQESTPKDEPTTPPREGGKKEYNQCKDEMEVVPIRSISGMLIPIYYSPKFLEELDTSEKKYLKNSKTRKTLPVVVTPKFNETTLDGTPLVAIGTIKERDEVPKFDLGTSPIKDDALPTTASTTQQTSLKMKGKGKQVADDTVQQDNQP